MDVVWMLIMAAGLAALAWLAFRYEPHWVARDGMAFTCRIQYLRPDHHPESRWRDARAFIDEGCVVLKPRGSVARTPKRQAAFTLLRQAESPPKGRVTYLMQSDSTFGGEYAVLRIPAKSRARANIEALLTDR
jgi:hypothetical protein